MVCPCLLIRGLPWDKVCYKFAAPLLGFETIATNLQQGTVDVKNCCKNAASWNGGGLNERNIP